MKIAICGAGLAGSYLYRLLKNEGKHEVQVFDKPHNTACGINSCGWGTTKGFEELVKYAGLNPEDYIIMRHDHVMMDEMKLKACLLTINKPKLIRDLLEGADIQYTKPNTLEFDRVIDATGVARAYLPPVKDDIIIPSVQYKMRSAEPNECKIKISTIGYAWSFPLSESVFHVGAVSLVIDPMDILLSILRKNEIKSTEWKTICFCQSRIRLTGPAGSRPFRSTPFLNANIWGVGEAIGCCAPFAGEGIIPGMRSAQILAQNLSDPEAYEREILKEFAWMEDERRMLDRFIEGEGIGIRSALTLMRTTKRMDMELTFWQALKMVWRIKK